MKLSPHRIDNERIGIVSSIIVPLPEAEDYIIRTEDSERQLTRTQEDYLKFYREIRDGLKDRIPDLALPEPSLDHTITFRRE